MARLSRLVVPQQPHYVSQVGHDGQPVFRDSEDYAAYLNWLREGARKFRVAIHAYALLPEHIALLATPSDEQGLSRLMQWVSRYYVPFFNAKYGRSGTLWGGRYKASVLDAPTWLLDCCRFIETLPVRAGAAAEPGDYRWSSFAHHAGTQADPLITDHPLYWALGNTPFEREAAWRRRMEGGLSAAESERLASALRSGWALGPETFRSEMEKKTGRRAGPARRGRPPKAAGA
jgi:putative transposase